MAGPRRLAASVDRRERRTVPVDADGDDIRIVDVQRPDRADHRRPPGPGILLGPAVSAAHIERVAAPRETQQPTVEADQAGLDLGRAEVDPEDCRFAHPALHQAVLARLTDVASSRATTASAVATSVTSVRTTPARNAPRIGRTLLSPDATPIPTGIRASRRAS